VFGGAVAAQLHQSPEHAEHHNVPWYTAVLRDNWKLIHYLQPGVGDELYDLSKDPEELENLIHSQNAGVRLAVLRKALAEELDRTKAGLPGAIQ
jgi:arylsulfatase A-like enzyme